MPIPTWNTGQVLSASDINEWFVPRFAYKTSDTSKTNDATLAADPHLVVTVDANAVYELGGLVIYSADSASSFGDIQIGWSGPAGMTGTWAGLGPGTTVISDPSGTLTADVASPHGYMVRTEGTDITATRVSGGITVSDILATRIRGLIHISATSGSFALNWSQAAASSSATTVYADSYISLRRVA